MKLIVQSKNKSCLLIILLFCFSSAVYSQLTGTKNIPGDFATVTDAVNALNTSGVGNGGIIFNVAANYKETIAETISLTASGTAANPIVFQKNPAATGANPLITAYANGTGTPATAVQDGIWRLVGSDYVTIDGIDVRDDPGNTTNPATMEYGFALYKASTSNGCQYVTIRNCVIALNNVNNATGIAPMVDGSAGIIVMNALPASATSALTPDAGGANSFNRFYKNTIRNCNTGIALIGYVAPSPYTLADAGNDVGGNDSTTGNAIINYGGAASAANAAVAIRTLAQYELNVSHNTINNNDGSGANHPNTLRGIYVNTAAGANATIAYNTITVQGGGTTQAVTGIENAAGSTAANNTINISSNLIVNSRYVTATTGGFYGINNTATPATLAINNNTLSNNSSSATATGFFYGILNSGKASTVAISGNEFSGNSTAALTSGLFAGIYNSASSPVVNITNNTLAGNSSSAVSGVYYAIYNTGTVTSAININANNIGTPGTPAISFTAVSSGSQVFIYNSKGAATATLSVSNNNFYNVSYPATGTGANTYILNAAATLSQVINNNTFNNLAINTAGSLTFISNNVAVPATGTQDVNNNAIQGTFTKAAGGTVTLFTSSASSIAGSVVYNNNNNFSNITVTGATTIAGWVNTDAGTSSHTVQNNTFSNWTAGTGSVTAISVNINGTGNATSGNNISNISGAGAVTGISTGAGDDNIYQNTMYALSTTGASVVTGISITSGTSKNVYRNKIYGLVANNAAGAVYGIAVSGSTAAVVTADIYNNLIGDLRAPVANASDAIRGISITSTRASSSINVYYNTIYLNAGSTGTNFGTSGVYHAGSATATTAALSLINNIITNTSIPNGTGLTVAFRRSNTSLLNYASASDNNLFYAGAPATNRLIYYDGTVADQTLTAYKSRVSSRDGESVTEDLLTSSKFLSTSGASASFLHLDPTKATLAESGAVDISSAAIDYDGQIRQGSSGYSGTGAAPDIGADEFNGIQSFALSGILLVGAGQAFTSLTNAGGLFAGINSLGLSGDLVVKVTSDLAEDGSNFLYLWTEQGIGNYTLTIQPDTSAARIVSGSVSTSLIRLNGAKRVIIDGSNGTGNKHLTFRNTNAAGTTATAFTFINGATNNTIRYCTTEAYANATNGVILFSTSTAAGGNSNNTVSNCNINATVNGNTGSVAIYSGGTAGNENSANTISNNNIYNYRDRGLDISSTGSTAWIILRNSFYNGDVAGAISYAAGTTLHGIRISGGAGYSIRNNYIGGNTPLASGTNAVYSSAAGILSFLAIQISTGSATPASEVKANVIASITVSSVPSSPTTASNTFIGIETNGSGINIGGTAAGDGNRIGSNTSNGSILVTTTTTSTANKSLVKGINCQSTGGFVTGNQVAGMDVQNVGSAPGPSTVYAIYVNAATAPSLVTNNIVGSTGTGAASNSIRVLSSSTSTATALNGITIGSSVTSTMQVSGNTVQNISYLSTSSAGNLMGISNTAASTAVVTFSGNTIASNTTAAATGSLYAIYNNGASTTLTISGNTVSGNSCTLNTSGSFYGIYNNAAPKSLVISGNVISGNTTTATTGALYGIYIYNSAAAPGAVTINNNTFSANNNPTSTGSMAAIYNGVATPSLSVTGNTVAGNTISSAGGLFYAVSNAGAVTGSITISSNNIGTGTSSTVTFNAANSGAQVFINNTGGTATAALSVSNNNFQGITYAQGGTGANTYIINSAATLSQAINSNTFTNLGVNTSGNITFISNNVVVPASGTQNVNNNSIVGSFTKRAGGTVTLFTSAAASAAGSVINNNNNNFSNITVTAATVIAGWINSDAGTSAKTIQDNTFSNWTGGTGAVTVLTVNLTGAGNSTKGNTISAIAGAGAVTGISTVAGNDNIYSNTINTLSTSGSAAVTAIAVTAGTAKNIYRNKIYDLSAGNAAGTVNGILVSGGATVNVYNNLIGDLRTPAANASTDAIRGISVTSATASSTINVYYNTIYINASSSGTNFSTSGIYHVASATATTAVLNARNNSITNTSTPKGTGLTVVYRRLGTALNNYASTANNNLLYAGTPGANRLIFHDGTNADQTLAAYKARVASRDAQSITEDLTAKFLSASGSSSVFLHMNTAIASAVESGAVNIDGFTEDYDGQVRAGNPGYSGASQFPDIGADEIFGIENVPPSISYTLLGNTTSTVNRTVTGVSITDASGVNTTTGTKPRIYYKRYTDANVWLDNTASTNGWKFTEAANSGSPYTFTINYSLLYGGAAVTAGVMQYFIVAQDLSTISNVAINSGTFSSNPAGVALNAAAFPIGGTINSYAIPFSGTYNVGRGEVFTSLTRADGLFAAINGAGLMGNTVLNITSDLAEDGVHALNQWAETGTGNYTMTIKPDAPTQRVITGGVAAGLIRLNGTDRLTVDGSNEGSGSYLNFINIYTAGVAGTAFTFINGAANNVIRHCTAEAYTGAGNGVILFSTSSPAGGNSNNLIDSCTIHATIFSSTGSVAIYSEGTAGNENANNTVSNNYIYDYRDRGLEISAAGSSRWVISGNSFYNGDVAGTIDYASSALYGINVLGGSGYSIVNNYIGGNDVLASGDNAVYTSTTGNLSFSGISVTTSGPAPASFIRGNTIAAVSLSAVPVAAGSNTFTGIETHGSGITIGGTAAGQGNVIGSAASNGSITVTTTTASVAYSSFITGVRCTSSGGLIIGNQMGGIDIINKGSAPAPSFFQGIYADNAAPPAQINNNLIGSTTASNSIRILPASASSGPSLTGIEIGTSVNAALQVNGNSIQNISNLSTVSSGSFTGINNTATASGASITISGDTVQKVNTAANPHAGSALYAGIVSGSAAVISNNLISTITLSSTGINALAAGIVVSGPYASTVSGNGISGLSTASTRATAGGDIVNPAGFSVVGILNTATVAGQVISNNTLAGLSATSAAGINTVVVGIGINAAGSGSIFNNRIASFTNYATGSGAGICGVTAAAGSFNVYNNAVRISNTPNTNGMQLYGIVHASGSNWGYYHNSIRIGGNSTGTALRSAAFLSPVNGPFVLQNNILYNVRTGTGSHYAVSNLASSPSAWPATAADYNNLYSVNANTVGEWGNAAGKPFVQWKTLSGGDGHSVSNTVSFLSSTYDLQPDSTSNCFLNNSGTPVTAPVPVSTDINGHQRNTVHPDLGAYEFSYAAFAIVAGSNSPVCAGDSVNLTVDAANVLTPAFSWRNPANAVISTSQNPSVTAVAGQYKVTVTDVNGCAATDSTVVAINPVPTARISPVASVCDSGMVNLRISAAGTGLISGTLSNGDHFSGTAPLIVVPVFVTATTTFSISDLMDGSCAALPAGLPDTVTVYVTRKGEWLGITSNWNDPVNWCGGIVPNSSTNIYIPAETAVMPVISDSAYCRNIVINTGDTLTIAGPGTLSIAGTLANYGTYLDNGTTRFNGSSAQQTFSGVSTVNNLVVDNAAGLLLPGNSIIKGSLTLSKGTLNANNFSISVGVNWINNASAAAYTAGAGTATFNGTGGQYIGGSFVTTFNNLTISKAAGTIDLRINSGVAGNLSVARGTFDLDVYTVNRATAGGMLTVDNNAVLRIKGTNSFPANYAAVNLVVAGTVEYAGVNQAVAGQTYGNLTLSSSVGVAVKTLPVTAFTVLGNFTSTAGAGTSVAFSASSNITVNGNVLIGASTGFTGGNYNHSIGGNWINNGTFTGSSGTIGFTGSGKTVSGTGVQNFNNLTVAASAVSFSSGSIALSGNLATTGPGSFTQAAGGTLLMSGAGKTIDGAGISLENLSVSGSVSALASLEIRGNLSVSGSFAANAGMITMSGTSKMVTGSGTKSFGVLSVTGAVTTTADFSVSSGLTVSGSLSASAGTATFTGTSSLSGTANLFNVILSGTSLQLSINSVLGIANTLSITSGLLDVTTSGNNTVNFNGPGNQAINAITYGNLVLSNGGTKTAAGAITTTDNITIGSGTAFNPSSHIHNIYGNWINNGSFITGTSTIQFRGPANSSVSGNTVFNILTINTTNAATQITLQSNVSAATVNMTNGMLMTGAATLTITGTRTGNGIILGNIQRMHAFATGIPYAFESPGNTITFSAASSVSSITVSVSKGTISDFPFGGSIGRVYNITVPAGTYTATLRLHYEDDELNGNNESSMVLWHYNGSSWANAGKSGNDTVANYVEKSSLTDIANRWTLSADANLVRWNGSVSSDWNTAANWTVIQGSGSRPPAASDIVNLGTTAFANQPVISTPVTVKNIVFGSAQPVVLTLAGGGTLTTLGDISGNWTAGARHAINVNNQVLTVNGSIILSDGTNGHAIDLAIGAGSVTTLGSLAESGGAAVNFNGAGTLNIYKDFNYGSGTFNAGTGTVIYNGNENQNIARVNYNNLVVGKPAGLAAINDSVYIAGNLLISSGELDNFSTTTIAGNVTIDAGGTLGNYLSLHVQGNWNNNGNYLANGSGTVFEGGRTQTISATTFNNLEIRKPASSLAVLTGNVVIKGNLMGASGTLDSKSFYFNRDVIGGTAVIGDSATLIIAADNAPNKFAGYALAPNSTVVFNGADAQHLLLPGIVYGNLTFRNAGLKTLYTPIIVKGRLLIDSTATLAAGSNTITLNGDWQNKGTFVPQTGTVLLNGSNRTVSGITVFNRVIASGSYTILNDVTFNTLLNITATGSLTGGQTLLVTMNGDLINSGVLYTLGTTTYTGNVLQTLSLINAVQTVAVTVNFNGSVPPLLNSTSAPEFGYLNISNTGGINPSVGWNIYYYLTIANGAAFNGGSAVHNIMGAVTNNGRITSSGTLNFIPSAPVVVNLGTDFASTGTVNFGGAGALTLAGTPASFYNVIISNTNRAGISPASGWKVANNFTVNSNSSIQAGSFSHLVGGNILNSGTINGGTGTFVLNGAGTQDISSTSAFNNLTINKANGIVNLSSGATVNGVLNFIAGNIQTGANLLTQPASGSVTGASQQTGWVNGRLQKSIATGNTARTFEVGDTVSYTPTSVAFAGVTAAGSLTASATTGDHPAIGSAMINTSKSVNRYWTLMNSGTAFAGYSATFSFLAADIDSGANPSVFGAGLYNGPSWGLLHTASADSTSIRITGATAFGDVAAGEVCNAGSTISYPDSVFCSNAGIILVSVTGSSTGAFSAAAGIALNTTTGAIDLSASRPGAYVVTYTLAASGNCPVYTAAARVAIEAAPSATLSYSGSPYCRDAGITAVTLSGTPGGVYRSAAGLSIDSTTGEIAPASSIPGTYTVAYTVAASGSCGRYQVTTSVTIADPPSATIDYLGSPYCSSAGVVGVTQTGTPGGIYRSAPGLSVNAVTGSLNTGTSTAGTYTVTYTVAAANGCRQFIDSTVVTITPLPTATISYSGNPFCNAGGTAVVTPTGTAGGTYSSSAGLSVDAHSGDINTGISIPGTYTVTYTIAPADGCGLFSASASVTINASGTWTGVVGNDWNTAENWQCNAVPVAATDVTIPAGLSSYPVISTGTSAIHNLAIQPGASLAVSGATLQIGGAIANNGSFDAGSGTIEMNGSSAQVIPAATFSASTIQSLRINNPAGVALTGALSLTDVLTISNGSLSAGGFLTLRSGATANARVAPVTSAAAVPVSGNVTVERYIPGARKYRLLTSAVTTSSSASLLPGQESLSIWGNWQHAGNNSQAHNGTFITGGSSTDGFDLQTSNASLFTYDDLHRLYAGFTTANGKNTKYTPLKAGVAYYMFVYGDRTNSIITPTPDYTVLNATGTLITGDQTYNTASSPALSPDTARFSLLGNPFASPINWATLPRTGVENTYWGWDPNLSGTGGYITVNTQGTVVLQAPISGLTGLNQYIQPGQGFFVKASGPSPQLIIREQDKVANFNGNVFGTPATANTLPLLAINLQYGSGAGKVLADGVVVAFDNAFDNKPGREDALKMLNPADNIAISNQNTLLSIDARKMPRSSDTLFLQLSKLARPQYTLQIFASQLEDSQLEVYLHDRYLNTLQPLMLHDTNNIAFDINFSLPASYDTNRFRIVFRSTVISLPVTYASVRAVQQDKDIQVNWDVAEETGIRKYVIEKSVNGTDFYTAGEVRARGGNNHESYRWLDVHPVTGKNYYRLRALQADGKFFFSRIAGVDMGGVPWHIQVYPNPVINQQLIIRSDYLEKGRYTLQIRDRQGQQTAYRKIEHSGGRLEQVIYFTRLLPSGIYYLEIGNKKEIFRQAIFVY